MPPWRRCCWAWHVRSPPSRSGQRDLQGLDDLGDELVLDGKDVGDAAIEAVGPDVAARQGVDELCVDANLIVRPLDTSLQHIADTKLLGDLADFDRLALVEEGRVSGDHEQSGTLGDP